MRYIIGIIFVLLLVAGCAQQPEVTPNQTTQQDTSETIDIPSEPEQTPEDSNGVEVIIDDLRFNPTTLEVPVGTTVVWTNRDNTEHTVTADTFDSGEMVPNAEFTHTFDEKGEYDYSCTLHPQMQGTIVVE